MELPVELRDVASLDDARALFLDDLGRALEVLGLLFDVVGASGVKIVAIEVVSAILFLSFPITVFSNTKTMFAALEVHENMNKKIKIIQSK